VQMYWQTVRHITHLHVLAFGVLIELGVFIAVKTCHFIYLCFKIRICWLKIWKY